MDIESEFDKVAQLASCDCPHCGLDAQPTMSRRALLGAFAGLTVAGIAPGSAMSHARHSQRASGIRTIELVNFHTGEWWTGPFWRDGRHVDDSVRAISHLMRDHRSGAVRRIDTNLLDFLWLVRRRLGSAEPWRILSGFRAPATHAALQRSDRNAARRSLHVEGRALDAALADRTAVAVARAARRERHGGVGLYARRGFVHLDSGPVRYWSL
jgi:uncharacterized protein YcbK (DUF882 family)